MARKCRSCREEIPSKKDCTDRVQAGGFCGMDCLMVHTRTARARSIAAQKTKRSPEEIARKRVASENSKSHQEQLTQQACNRMVRLLDAGKPCISCGRYQCGSAWHAGHFRSVAACPELRFDPRNIHLQGSGCNTANRTADKNSRRKSETIAQEYQSRLRSRIGDNLVDWVLGPHPMPHWSCDDLRALRAVFLEECRRLQAGQGASRDWRAPWWELSDLINKL